MSRPFLKMNGLGNDFVVVEARTEPFAPSAEEVRAIADRERGIGCDQLISIEPTAGEADVRVRFWNADGEEVGACGNGSRCVGWLVMEAAGRDQAVLEVGDRLLRTTRAGEGLVSVDMGAPGLDWTDIPLDEPMDTKGIELQVGPIDAPLLHTPGAVSMGNPHVVFFVDDIETAPVAEVGPMIEHHRLFPEGVNVGFAQVIARDHIRLRVWERGAGLTKACGTGACAALVACARRGLTDRTARLELDGGDLTIEWREADNHVIMTGPASLDFTGTLP
ncbi:diaminopimelate epimerase [Phenylobacterium sp.]|uniref:diaminopimelate epimerase n=1 Tax=Phenylobacterium sp. TaxID=1871053 RepID=UPI00272F048D|nr:diaminopimelate epimerase [Phenylobacterium sp.]MDP1872652.1 diaminopimelate epimerase [Phenylobacterium sp.]MDP3298724.1 diaminopimelate epimerase [Phenylobacterium sp.]